MPQKKMEDWISPQEASLVQSVLKGVYISPDDIKQVRRNRMPEGDYIQASEKNTVYRRAAIEQLDIKKRQDDTFFGKIVQDRYGRSALTIVANWLHEFPYTIQWLESQGYTVPLKEEAMKSLVERHDQSKTQKENA